MKSTGDLHIHAFLHKEPFIEGNPERKMVQVVLKVGHAHGSLAFRHGRELCQRECRAEEENDT